MNFGPGNCFGIIFYLLFFRELTGLVFFDYPVDIIQNIRSWNRFFSYVSYGAETFSFAPIGLFVVLCGYPHKNPRGLEVKIILSI